jgi:hypothetical protein
MKIWRCPNCKRERKYFGRASLVVCNCMEAMEVIDVEEDKYKVEVRDGRAS